jgi:NAD(P)-dependent dehydrogenase (short-subunit alcohol dehydrogenase family)
MAQLLAQQVVLVTGAARGIGQAIAQVCVREGATVELADRLGDELQATTTALQDAGGTAHANICDLSDEAAVRGMFADILRRHGRIDGLVNNAGTTVYGGSLDTSLDDLRRTMDMHIAPTLLCSQQAARQMVQQGRGAIVNMSSAAAGVAVTRFFAYAMAKSAINSLTRHMATELGERGVTVNAIAPGPVLTEALKRNQNMAMQRMLLDDIPAARFAQPSEIGEAAMFLLSQGARYINGHVLHIDGGLSAAGTRLDRLAA